MMSVFNVSVLLMLLVAQTVSAAEVQLEVSVRSQPSYRGILQAVDDQPVWQGLAEVVAEDGFYAGIWASRLMTERDERNLEVDFFVGYQRRWTEFFATDVTLQRYTFYGADFGADYDWNELQVAVHVGDHVTMLAAVGDNWAGRDERSHVLEATYRYALVEWLTAYATVGQHFASNVIGDNFAYREVGGNAMWGNIVVQLSWADAAGWQMPQFVTDQTWSVSIARRFSF